MKTKKHILSLLICSSVLLPSLSYAEGVMFRSPLDGVSTSSSEDVDNSEDVEDGESTPEPEPELEGIQEPKDVVFTNNGLYVTGNVNAAANIVAKHLDRRVTVFRVDSDENGDFETALGDGYTVYNGDPIGLTITDINDSNNVIYSEITAVSDAIRTPMCLEEGVEFTFGDKCYHKYGKYAYNRETVMYVGTYNGENHFLKELLSSGQIAEAARVRDYVGASSRTDGYANSQALLSNYYTTIKGSNTPQGECFYAGDGWFLPAADVVQNIIDNKEITFPFLGIAEQYYDVEQWGFFTSTEKQPNPDYVDDWDYMIRINYLGEEEYRYKRLSSRHVCTISESSMPRL